MWAEEAFNKLIHDYEFQTVLDIGSGAGEQAQRFRDFHKDVTEVDHGRSIYFQKNPHKEEVVIGDFNTLDACDIEFDCVWASHVLEHQRNVGLFLDHIYQWCRMDGIVAITVPPAHQQILGGHLTIWSAGLLLYNMVLAGFDCHEARIKTYGFNVSLIVRKKPAVLPVLDFDNGDVDRIAPFLPEGLHENFDGIINELNWNT